MPVYPLRRPWDSKEVVGREAGVGLEWPHTEEQ
jgi:hypothetical protein